jgi:hypothetical protein
VSPAQDAAAAVGLTGCGAAPPRRSWGYRALRCGYGMELLALREDSD